MKKLKEFLIQDPFGFLLRTSTLIVILMLIFTTAAAAVEQGRKTLFLPLKITTVSGNSRLSQQADLMLQKVLYGTEYLYLPRQKASSLLDYQDQWPPSHKSLSDIPFFQDYTNLVVGSLTEVGGVISADFKVMDLLSPSDTKYISMQSDSPESFESLFKDVVTKVDNFTSRAEIIASIAPQGNEKIDSGAILQKITTQPGDPYNPGGLREDLRAIFKMGYFDDIQIEVTQEPDGKAVFFIVKEKPVIRSLLFSGIDELEESTVKEVVTIKEQDILNPIQIKKNADAIQQLYKTKGYYNTTVTPEITYPTKDSAEVLLAINEGEKIYIKEIRFEGNTTFDDDDLEDEIETSTKGWFSWISDSGLLDYDKLKQDAGRIVNFYSNHGFLETKISDPIVTQKEEWLYITFNIEEGTRFRVGEVTIEGDLLDSKEKLLNMLTIADETYVSRKILREDILKITDFFAEKGYANANIHPRIRTEGEDLINITVTIDKGELVHINRITITGNTRTRDNVIRRELKVEEGGIFDAKALRESLQGLQYLDFFEEVSITPQRSFDTSTVDLSVDIKEKSTGQFTIGAGYSSVDHLILMGEIAENNFLGRGDTLALSGTVGGESNEYRLRYSNPHLNDSQLSWSADIFDIGREYDDYTKDSTGGSLGFGYPVWEKWRGYGSYSYTDTVLSDVAENASFIIQNSVDINITSALRFSLQRDTRNRRFGASKGSKHNISVEYAGGPLGGDSQFTKVEGYTTWYFPLFWNTVFHFHGAAGQAFENEDNGLPVYERFFLGGLRSIRGFDYSKVSPIDPATGERIGGDKMWYTNFEYIFPLLAEQGVNGVVFFDMGYVFNDDEDWGFDEFKKSVGLGIRWFSPMGPLRLEWGYNLDPQDDEDRTVWDFTIGGIF